MVGKDPKVGQKAIFGDLIQFRIKGESRKHNPFFIHNRGS